MTVEDQLEIDLLIYGNAYCHVKKINGIEHKTRIDPTEMRIITPPISKDRMDDLLKKHFGSNEKLREYMDNLKNEKQ